MNPEFSEPGDLGKWWPEAADRAPHSNHESSGAGTFAGSSSVPRSAIKNVIELGVDRAPAEAMARQKAALHKRREAEANDALDFLFLGDDEGRHAAKCVHALAGGVPCSRNYDPNPVPEAAPHDPRLYEGTGIALLYGLPGGEAHAAQLAGWNVRREQS